MRPKVIINCAASVDGKIALPSRAQTAISSKEDLARVHRLRASVDAILVGVGTVLTDDPRLVVKPEYVKGARNPLRVVLDSSGRTPVWAKVLDDRAKTIIFTNDACKKTWKGAEAVRLGGERVDMRKALDLLGERGVKTLMVEGGATIIWEFARLGLFDELKIFVGSIVIGGKGPTVADGAGAINLDGTVKLRLEKATPMDGGVLLEYVRG